MKMLFYEYKTFEIKLLTLVRHNHASMEPHVHRHQMDLLVNVLAIGRDLLVLYVIKYFLGQKLNPSYHLKKITI